MGLAGQDTIDTIRYTMQQLKLWDQGHPDADRVGYSYIYLHKTTCGTRDRVGHSQSEIYKILFYILTRLWDTGLAGQDTIDTIIYAIQ